MRDAQDPQTAELLRLGAFFTADWNADLQEILRGDSDVLGVDRVNYWRLRDNPPAIVCELGYEAPGHRLDRGFVLREAEAPRYFAEIQRSQVLAIEDARHDPRCRGLLAYLDAHDVRALLDVPVRLGSRPVGILCHEQLGHTRQWSAREQQFALGIGQIVSARLEARVRSKAEGKERQVALLVDVLSDLAQVFEDGPAADLAVSRALPTLGEMAGLVSFEGGVVRNIAEAHRSSEGLALLKEIMRRYPPRLDGPGFISYAVRQGESVLLQEVTREALRPYGVDDEYFALIEALHVRSLMTVLLSVRRQLRGAMVFATTCRQYDQHDLRFAEFYAQQVGAALENARLYQKAQNAIRARDEFLSLASHELRTPVTALALAAQALARHASSAEAVAEFGRRIARQVDRLNGLADRLLDASELAGHGLSVRRQPLDLSELVRDVAHGFEERALAVGSRLELRGDEVVEAELDPVRIQQAVSNLVDNAIKFGRGAPIEVQVRADDGQAVVSVRDHGVGIPSHEQVRAFERYGVGKAGRSVGGLGLGLYVVRKIAEAHGGRVRLESESGAGTRVSLELPLTPAGTPPAADGRPVAFAGGPAHRSR